MLVGVGGQDFQPTVDAGTELAKPFPQARVEDAGDPVTTPGSTTLAPWLRRSRDSSVLARRPEERPGAGLATQLGMGASSARVGGSLDHVGRPGMRVSVRGRGVLSTPNGG